MAKNLKLNQVIAIEKTAKSQAYADFSTLHQLLQKTVLLSGIVKTYQPLNEDDPDFVPDERTSVQVRTEPTLATLAEVLTRAFDVTATKDWGNQKAKADVVVGGTVLLKDVPVTYLLFLEKQITDLHTMIKKLQVLDPAEQWHWDANAEAYATNPVRRTRTKKVPRNHVMAEASQYHPAQVQVYQEEVVVGYTTTIKHSGAIDGGRHKELVSRVETLLAAVKTAREEANMTEVEDIKVGEKVFTYLFGA